MRGLRYPVEFLLELLSSGISTEQILADYSDLEADDLRAVYAYAARLSRVQRIARRHRPLPQPRKQFTRSREGAKPGRRQSHFHDFSSRLRPFA